MYKFCGCVLIVCLVFALSGCTDEEFKENVNLFNKQIHPNLPSEPEVTEYSFNFELVYEEKGKKKTIRDSIVCKYDGIEEALGLDASGWCRKWSCKLASGDENIVLWSGYNEQHNRQEIIYTYGMAEYYMGDPEYQEAIELNSPGDIYLVTYEMEEEDGEMIEEMEYTDEYSKDELFQKTGIKIISWECDPPVEQSFKEHDDIAD